MVHYIRPLFSALCCAFLGLSLIAAPARAGYPEKPVRIVVPFPASGAADIIGRVIGAKLAEQWGQPVIIENRVGASGNIGTEAVARASADGYTILLGSSPNMVINPSLYPKTSFDTVKDFVPIIALASAPNILVVNPSVPVQSVRELVAYAKARPDTFLFASAANGTTGHLSMELLQLVADIKVRHIAYKGAPQATMDLISGQVNGMFFTIPSLLPHIKSGKLRALAVTSEKRMSLMPDLPTMAEAGYPTAEATAWFGLFAPRGTPKAVIDRIQASVEKVMAMDEVRSKLVQQGADPMTESGERFGRMVRADLAKWADIVKRSGATVD